MIYATVNKNNSCNVQLALLLSLPRSRPSKLAHNLVGVINGAATVQAEGSRSLLTGAHSRLNCSSCLPFAVLCVTWCTGVRAQLICMKMLLWGEQWLMQIVRWKSVHRSLEHSWQWMNGCGWPVAISISILLFSLASARNTVQWTRVGAHTLAGLLSFALSFLTAKSFSEFLNDTYVNRNEHKCLFWLHTECTRENQFRSTQWL